MIFLYFTSRSLPLVLSNMYLNNFFIYFWWVQSTDKTNHLGMNVVLNTSIEEMMILNQIIIYVFIKKKNPLCQQRNDELANIYSYNTFNNMHVWYIFILLYLMWNIMFHTLSRAQWPNELGSWITKQLIQAYHQYGVGSRPAL